MSIKHRFVEPFVKQDRPLSKGGGSGWAGTHSAPLCGASVRFVASLVSPSSGSFPIVAVALVCGGTPIRISF